MGHRNLICVWKDGEHKLCEYRHWGADPDENGNWLATMFSNISNVELLKRRIPQLVDKKVDSNSEGLSWLDLIMDPYNLGPFNVSTDPSFAGNSLWCEYAYVIDLDLDKLVVCRGFTHRDTHAAEPYFSDVEVPGEDYGPVDHLFELYFHELFMFSTFAERVGRE